MLATNEENANRKCALSVLCVVEERGSVWECEFYYFFQLYIVFTNFWLPDLDFVF